MQFHKQLLIFGICGREMAVGQGFAADVGTFLQTGPRNENRILERLVGNACGVDGHLGAKNFIFRLGRIDEALGYLKKQADLFPKQARLWSDLAETWKLKRNFDSAVYYINRAIEIESDAAGLYVNKAMYYAELKGDLATATSVLKNASSLVDTNEFKPDFIYLEILKGAPRPKAEMGKDRKEGKVEPEALQKVDNDTINAVDPNLSEFVAHGGKLFMYHGWADPNVAPRASVEYYNNVVEVMNCGNGDNCVAG